MTYYTILSYLPQLKNTNYWDVLVFISFVVHIILKCLSGIQKWSRLLRKVLWLNLNIWYVYQGGAAFPLKVQLPLAVIKLSPACLLFLVQQKPLPCFTSVHAHRDRKTHFLQCRGTRDSECCGSNSVSIRLWFVQ